MIENDIQEEREELLNFCSRFEKIYLYGAGQFAGLMIRLLEKEKINIVGVIVSDGHKNIDEIKGYKVSELSGGGVLTDAGIILGVAPDKKYEIKKALMKFGIERRQIFDKTDLICHSEGSGVYCFDNLLKGKLADDVWEDGYFSEYKDLEEIGLKCNTDKSSLLHNYLVKYEFFLNRFKNKSFNLLELGVFDGASLKMWEEFFPNANVYGVDIDKRCKNSEGGRRKVMIMDLGDKDNFDKLKEISPAVIIDDASHIWSHQINALFNLFPILPSGGVFIMEDLETSFSGYRYCGYNDCNVSTYEICSLLAEVVCGQEVIKQSNVSADIWALKDEIEKLALQIEMISFIHGSCIMIRNGEVF